MSTAGRERGEVPVFRSLHMKLVLIMLLLITSLMTVVGDQHHRLLH